MGEKAHPQRKFHPQVNFLNILSTFRQKMDTSETFPNLYLEVITDLVLKSIKYKTIKGI